MNLSEFTERLKNCDLCPRICLVDRTKGEYGYCAVDDKIYISSICIHRGEEPPVSGKFGLCNVFFAHCNMQCIYCQNYQISDNKHHLKQFLTDIDDVVKQIVNILKTGINSLGFVSPTHQVVQMLKIIDGVKNAGFNPIIVYNTNGYELVETIRELSDIVDIYLPDFKYFDNKLSKLYSDCAYYPEIAINAIKEMYRQKGKVLKINENDYAESGLIVRHLVLPGHIDNTKKALEQLSLISEDIYISLMSQFYPTPNSQKFKTISQGLKQEEYDELVDYMDQLGLYNGWIQEIQSMENYRPDFNKIHPFEDQ